MKSMLLIIIGIIAVSHNVGAFAEESGITYDVFDNPPKFFGDKMIIATPEKTINDVRNAGSISVIDVDTNSLLYTINNPYPTGHDMFGRNIAVSENYIIVGVQEQTNTPAEIYVFDGMTGSLLHTIKNPNEESDINFHSTFGRNIGTMGDNIVVGSYFYTSDDFETYLVHVFDGETGSLIYTIENPIPESISFGETFESFDNKLAVYAVGEEPNNDIIHVFSGQTGALLYTIDGQIIATDDYSRITTIIVNDNIVVGVPVGSFDSLSSGMIHTFDGNTGSLLYTINDPEETDRNFGAYIIPAGDNIAVRTSETIYFYEGSTGKLLHIVDHPSLSNVELAIIVDSFNDTDYFFVVLIVSVVFVGIGMMVYWRKRK